MRIARSLTLLAVMATSASARAQDGSSVTAGSADASVTQVPAAPAPAASSDLPFLGVMTDVGIPDGLQGSIVLRPAKALRASVGGGYNMISKGVRVGLSLLPFGRGPSGTVEAGRYFAGDANAAVAQISGANVQGSVFSPLLQRVGYDYVNAHLGLDFGYKRATFYIHGGMSYVRGTIPKQSIADTFNNQPSINGETASGTQITVKSDATVTYIGPSAKIGLIVYLW
ncbi:MAG TPA: hypothetical protein VH560_11290 [Polyangia bacterium]|jgi:hypothetical protein|nr:hypothetical protein [Polyangia bacterium]